MSHILIVDDDLMFRELLKDTLELEGIAADIATNGQDALKHIEANMPSIVVLDLKMPLVSGNEIIRWIRAQNLYQGIKLIVVTGHTDAKSIPEAQMVDAIFTKPVPLDMLIDQINQLLIVDVS